MSQLITTTKITLDFTVPRIKNVRCVQNDKETRMIHIWVTNEGEPFPLDAATMTARYKIHKPDHTYIYHETPINSDGTVTINLTEQAMAATGVARSELQISDLNGKILSTMPFHIIVEKSAASNQDILSSNESDVINGMIKHLIDYENPHQVTKAQVGLGNADNTADKDKHVLSASKLTTPVTINNTTFDGTANITTETWGTHRTLTWSGAISGTAAINGESDVTIETTLNVAPITNEQIDSLF